MDKEIKEKLITANNLSLLQLERELKGIEEKLAWYRRCIGKKYQGVCDLLDGKITPKQFDKIPMATMPWTHVSFGAHVDNIAFLHTQYMVRQSVIEGWNKRG